MSLCDHMVFLKLKIPMKDTLYKEILEIEAAVTVVGKKVLNMNRKCMYFECVFVLNVVLLRSLFRTTTRSFFF